MLSPLYFVAEQFIPVPSSKRKRLPLGKQVWLTIATHLRLHLQATAQLRFGITRSEFGHLLG